MASCLQALVVRLHLYLLYRTKGTSASTSQSKTKQFQRSLIRPHPDLSKVLEQSSGRGIRLIETKAQTGVCIILLDGEHFDHGLSYRRRATHTMTCFGGIQEWVDNQSCFS